MTKNRLSLFVLSLLSFLTTANSNLFADSFVVAPNANTAVNGSTSQGALFGDVYLPGFGLNGVPGITFQWDIAASQLTSLVGDSIDAVGFRLPSGAASISGTTPVFDFGLQLSSSLNPIGSLNLNQEANIAPNAVTVYSGDLTLGPLTGGTGPNPFFLIDFSTPFTYTGGDLLLTETYVGPHNFDVDAIPVGSIIDTSADFENMQTDLSEVYNAPVTELQYAPAASPIPEPGSLTLLGTGVAGLFAIVRKRLAEDRRKAVNPRN